MQPPIPYTEGEEMNTASKPEEGASLQDTNPQNTKYQSPLLTFQKPPQIITQKFLQETHPILPIGQI